MDSNPSLLMGINAHDKILFTCTIDNRCMHVRSLHVHGSLVPSLSGVSAPQIFEARKGWVRGYCTCTRCTDRNRNDVMIMVHVRGQAPNAL